MTSPSFWPASIGGGGDDDEDDGVGGGSDRGNPHVVRVNSENSMNVKTAASPT